jgi:hypothetical protein
MKKAAEKSLPFPLKVRGIVLGKIWSVPQTTIPEKRSFGPSVGHLQYLNFLIPIQQTVL